MHTVYLQSDLCIPVFTLGPLSTSTIFQYVLVLVIVLPTLESLGIHLPPPQISRDLHNSRGFPENYVAIGCLLAEHGAKFDRDSLTRNSGCSTYFVNLIVSYAGKSSRT